jgi:hypothetical protein
MGDLGNNNAPWLRPVCCGLLRSGPGLVRSGSGLLCAALARSGPAWSGLVRLLRGGEGPGPEGPREPPDPDVIDAQSRWLARLVRVVFTMRDSRVSRGSSDGNGSLNRG